MVRPGRREPHAVVRRGRPRAWGALALAAALAVILAGCVVQPATDATPGENPAAPTASASPISTAASASPTERAPNATPTAAPVAHEAPTATPIAPASPEPLPTAAPPPTVAPRVDPTATEVADAFVIGGINLADAGTPITISYPRDLDGDGRVTVTGVDILVSDEAGTSLATFSNIGSWLGTHKVFVYPDTVSGRPIVSVHNGTYAGVPLEAEPLRRMLEGPVFSPHAAEIVQENLARLVGARFALEQGDAAAEFEVTQAIRMDAATTADFSTRAGELSTLLEPLEEPEHTFLWLMCSTRQPGEPDVIFPARFVLALKLVP